MRSQLFGTLSDGRPVNKVILENLLGMQLGVIEYGAAVSDLVVPMSEGYSRNIILGYPDLDGYLNNGIFCGATIGRTAGRVSRGRFSLDGMDYTLEINNPPNNVHGGSVALDKKIWKAVQSQNPKGETVTFKYRSPSGEQGFPGNLSLEVSYTLLRDRNCVRIDYYGVSDRATPLNLTNHAYFNLNGTKGTSLVDNHVISINADYYTPAGGDMTLLGTVRALEGTPADLRLKQNLGEAITAQYNQHGENYILRSSGSRQSRSLQIAATAAVDDLILEVRTDADCLQFYGGQYIPDDHPGRFGQISGSRSGFCLECQDYPDGINCPEISDIILRPGETYCRSTEWDIRESN